MTLGKCATRLPPHFPRLVSRKREREVTTKRPEKKDPSAAREAPFWCARVVRRSGQQVLASNGRTGDVSSTSRRRGHSSLLDLLSALPTHNVTPSARGAPSPTFFLEQNDLDTPAFVRPMNQCQPRHEIKSTSSCWFFNPPFSPTPPPLFFPSLY